MRKVSVLIILLLSLVSSAYAKPRLAVRAFDDKTEDQIAPSDAVTEMMVTELSKAKIFNLIEREQLKYLEDEYALARSGMLDPSTAPQRGKIKAAEYTMTGAITMYYYNEKGKALYVPSLGGAAQAKTAYVTLDLRIFDSESNIVYAAAETGTASRELSGFMIEYKEFFIGKYKRQYGGILASAVRDAIVKHVNALKKEEWPQ